MSTNFFSVPCLVCGKEITRFTQSVNYILTDMRAVQEHEEIRLSCGCVIDFPDWQIDVTTGACKIYNFAGTLYIAFNDDEMILEEDE